MGVRYSNDHHSISVDTVQEGIRKVREDTSSDPGFYLSGRQRIGAHKPDCAIQFIEKLDALSSRPLLEPDVGFVDLLLSECEESDFHLPRVLTHQFFIRNCRHFSRSIGIPTPARLVCPNAVDLRIPFVEICEEGIKHLQFFFLWKRSDFGDQVVSSCAHGRISRPIYINFELSRAGSP